MQLVTLQQIQKRCETFRQLRDVCFDGEAVQDVMSLTFHTAAQVELMTSGRFPTLLS